MKLPPPNSVASRHSLEQLQCSGYQSHALSSSQRAHLYSAFLSEARQLADDLAAEQAPEEYSLDSELEDLKFFSVPTACVGG